MDLEKFLADRGLQGHPAGLGGCRAHGDQFDSCDHDVVVFDGGRQGNRFLPHEGQFVNLHHCPIDATRTDSLVHLDGMRIVLDGSWDLGMLLSGLRQRRSALFRDYARNCLVGSLLCCEKCLRGPRESGAFSACWQKCASHMLADAILALNQRPPSPSHALEIARRFEKNAINGKMSVVAQTLGIERASPPLLERMLKSTIGFSDMAEGNGHPGAIGRKHGYFVENSMFSDCYFYLGCVNRDNFLRMKASLPRRPDLIHVLKTAFDLEADPVLVSQHARRTRDACHEILGLAPRG